MKNYYEILGVPQDADPHQIKKAYRERARQFHPDSNSTEQPDDGRFIEVTEAYRSLSDPFSRARHDHALKQQWRVSQSTSSNQPQYLSTENVKPFMWILATVLSFTAFMMCVLTILIIEYSPEKSSAVNPNEQERLQAALETSDAQDRAVLNTLLSDDDDLSCSIHLIAQRSNCGNIPIIRLSDTPSGLGLFRITLNPSVGIIQSVQLDFELGDSPFSAETGLIYIRDLRPNATGDHTEIQVYGDTLNILKTESENQTQLSTENLSTPPITLILSRQTLSWVVDGQTETIELPELFLFPANEDERTIDLWFSINRPLDDGSQPPSTPAIESVTLTFHVDEAAAESE